MERPKNMPEGWVLKPELEKLLPSRINKQYGLGELDKLISENNQNGLCVLHLGLKDEKNLYCFSPVFIALWKTQVQKMEIIIELIYIWDGWFSLEDLVGRLVSVKDSKISIEKLEEILSLYYVRQRHPYLFRMKYTGDTYPDVQGQFVELVHEHAIPVIDQYIKGYVKDHIDKVRPSSKANLGRGYKTRKRPNLDQLDGNFS